MDSWVNAAYCKTSAFLYNTTITTTLSVAVLDIVSIIDIFGFNGSVISNITHSDL